MSIATVNARTVRTAVASVTLMAAALTLAACNNDDAEGVKRSGAAQSSAAADAGAKGGDKQDATGGADAGAQGGAQAGGDGKAPAPSGSAGADGANGSGSKITTCDPSKVSMTVSKVSRPVNHLLLKATNNSGVICDLPYFPVLRFDDAQAATPEAEETKPQAVVSLEPGKSGYAGILTSSADGSGTNGTKVTELSVYLKGKDAATSVALPGGSVYIDDSAQVTYWQSDSSDALNW
ncbi:DUF4232 domain-containing protein [Streptomyces cucumeris]|uniref:DUF4232 domain-containing protein n=1 Tax=Streptomyces cucumeris TaxID=2962890 RepID=UPI0020C83AE7|nr:DUF4232 domain-containing protein [Streptomyces sp. NEAU-Y11]MCP9212699.1 DUF4232 domain-containing protein [Streptomyces sp. NEAU-Y11]